MNETLFDPLGGLSFAVLRVICNDLLNVFEVTVSL